MAKDPKESVRPQGKPKFPGVLPSPNSPNPSPRSTGTSTGPPAMPNPSLKPHRPGDGKAPK